MSKASVTDDLFSAYDAIHGSIDVRDVVDEKCQAVIARLLRSRLLERLRSIKQLGFVSRGYPAADHSRFGHAVGTMQMMRKLYHRIRSNDGLPEELLANLNTRHELEGEPWDQVANHLMLAALLQDIGELPYHQATKEFFPPSQEIRDLIKDRVGEYDFTRWKSKDVFTVGCLLSRLQELEAQSGDEILKDFSLPLLVYLITEQSRNGEDERLFLPLRHMLDGAVDADRLDYVYRDGHHTIGYFGTPQAVVDSLLRYTDEGPVFSDPAPVSNLLLMRAHLYITVYLSAADRFQTQLLRTILADVKKIEPQQPKETQVFRTLLDSVDAKEFLELDDASLISKVQAVEALARNGKKGEYKGLSNKTRKTLGIFLEQQGDYESIWILPPEAGSASQEKIALPDGLFFDNFSDKDLQIYRPETIRIQSSRFGNAPVLLEETSGIFRGIADGKWSPLPKPGSILLFKPKKLPAGDSWKKVAVALADGSLYHHLIPKLDVEKDTRSRGDFLPPDLFISHAFIDRPKMFQIAAELGKRKQRYFFLDRYGPNKPAPENIRESVSKAEAVLILLSPNFLSRLDEERNGNLSVEVQAIAENLRQRDLPVAMINLNAKKEQIETTFPWTFFGWLSMPVVQPLDISNQNAVGKELERVMSEIHRKLRPIP